MRVHELAKEFELTSKELMDRLHGLSIDAKNHMSTLNEEQIRAVRHLMQAERAPAASAAASEPPPEPTPPEKKVILVHGPVVVREFAEQLGMKPNQVIAALMGMNVFASINQKIDLKVAQVLAERQGFVLEQEKKPAEKKPQPPPKKEKIKEPAEDLADELKVRPPVVTFMGHVDHGKTSLLDRIRNTKVAAGEHGGITQHIGAYTVKVGERYVTFLDTPGHEAFTAMRARGANLTDIVVVVIDAAEGIMPQTREAIQHAKAANVCIMIALNKIDLRAANAERVKQQLQREGLAPEDWGGDVICCPVSAATGQGVDHLLEMIALQAEVLELKANANRRAEGFVIEAQLEQGRGPTATLLVRRGTLRVGDAMVCGPYWGRVKALINDKGEKVKTAGPSAAVKCLGLADVPESGAAFQVYAVDREAKEISEQRLAELRLKNLESAAPRRASLEDLMRMEDGPAHKELSLVIKTDAQGSLEAIQHALSGIKSDKVSLKIVLAGVGSITANDVLLASASNAVVVGFHTGKEPDASAVAKREGVEIRLYNIIYELSDEIRDAMLGLLEPVLRENVIGFAEIRQVFDLGKKGRVAGCLVANGKVTSRCRARVKRKGDVLYQGNVASLRRFQNDASEVREGQECGIRLDNFGDYQPGDVIEAYEVEKMVQQL
jgi:translation initiation factor IF-2